jgi:hypothetical protein
MVIDKDQNGKQTRSKFDFIKHKVYIQYNTQNREYSKKGLLL